MATTPGKPRTSIPTPGKSTGIPTPGRLRSASNSTYQPVIHTDDEFIARAFADAIKANDPGHHRTSLPMDPSSDSLAPYMFSNPSQSSRRSSGGRPSSVASHTSGISSSNSRGLDSSVFGSSGRPLSRTSDAFSRNASRATRAFEVGDSVRIESLGFEGTLRYIGEIDGKNGTWAGVELSGGFSGKGKNNGSVAGKQYFVCPPNCGVFVASTKLSLPTVGVGNMSRPSSVASSRSGRITPSVSGKMTPSSSISTHNGRKTPSVGNGRVTPSLGNGRVTPSAQVGRKTPGIPQTAIRARAGTSYGPAKTPTRLPSREENITPGSRASKYVGMTAKQLSSRASGSDSPTRKASTMSSPSRSSLPSPIQATSHLPSPTRSVSSPFGTPKVGRTSNIGLGPLTLTPSKSKMVAPPRPRIPSAIAMPPPASPSTLLGASRSMSLDDPSEEDEFSDLTLNGRRFQDKISAFMSGGMTSPSLDRSSRPASSVSLRSGDNTSELRAELDRLQARLEATENENERLRNTSENSESTISDRLTALVDERDKVQARVAELEISLRSKERLLSERDVKVEGLERAAQEAALDLEKAKNDSESRTRDLISKLEDSETLISHLKEIVEAKEGEQSENNAALAVKNAEITMLESRVEKACTELEEERRILNGQVDELRKAGQETIALYEERLSAADAKRYEMEDNILALEEQLRNQAQPLSPSAAARHTSSATEIDNESLREQVQHLQRKISTLEDMLEDTRAAADRDDAAARERIKRYKEREEQMRLEVAESLKEVDRLAKAEERARLKVEEVEEALRESTVALENARAEVESMRAEVVHLEGLNAENGSPRQASTPGRDSDDRAQLLQEIVQLKHSAEELEEFKAEHAVLEASLQHEQFELEKERQITQNLRQQLEERNTELDATRKKLNRDLPLLQHDTNKPISPSKHDLASAKDEITGLKHIVQQLQKDSAALTKHNQVLEAENKLLVTETEQLREDLRTLEDNVEQSIERDEQAFLQESSAGDSVAVQRQMREQSAKLETEVEQLRKRVSESEMKHARQVHDLNKEITELETLVESKIYKEEDLERENEKLKSQLARLQKKTSRTTPVADFDALHDEPVNGQTLISKPTRNGEEVCEICERPGHDIFTCDLLKDGGPVQNGAIGGESQGDIFCEDCEERGHTAANCPHSLDVF